MEAQGEVKVDPGLVYSAFLIAGPIFPLGANPATLFQFHMGVNWAVSRVQPPVHVTGLRMNTQPSSAQ